MDDRADGYCGIAFAIRKDLLIQVIQIDIPRIPNRVQLIGIKIDNLNVYNIYIPPDIQVDYRVMRSLTSFLQRSYLFVGDMNSEKPSWGSGWLNHNGSNIEA
ncbi:hypothetical protein HHI36_001611 [Cryptolaemus montrouzieri]|uniref:Endonuclease/exonuclease/phosphatase domain-containing protein n=1 Tax=Cryptolaemus montrouzieri TaxID=559131 RepID=A0ABD2P859_9CUCU